MAASSSHLRLVSGFVLLFALYQSAEGIGADLLHNEAVSACLMIAALVAAWPVGIWLGYRGYDAYGLDLRPASARLVLGGLVLAAVVRLAFAFCGQAAGVYSLGAPPPAHAGLALVSLIAGTALSTFVPSITEDILTRGFWLKASGIKWTGWTFAAGTAAIYTLNHIFRLADGPGEWLRLFCFGLAYGCACWKWRNLWGAVGLHWGWNLTNAMLDSLINLNVADTVAAPFYSAAAHLVMAAVVLLWPGTTRDA